MYYSPLRYPGGKGKLAPFMRLLVDKFNIRGGTYIEPFAGGAGIALDLLFNDIVGNIVINDYDKAIASFWKAVVNENERFIDTLYNTPISVDEWNRQRTILMTANSYSFELGFATFFLNRTNRSGILKGGIIGGKSQEGNWKIDARFNKDELAKRILAVGKRKNDIHIYNKDVTSFIERYAKKYGNDALVYFDPPYFNKGKDLYLNYFNYSDHKRIEKCIREELKCNWIITYDDVYQITDIYKEYEIRRFDLNYSLKNKRVASEIMIFKNSEMCPDNNELVKNNININFR